MNAKEAKKEKSDPAATSSPVEEALQNVHALSIARICAPHCLPKDCTPDDAVVQTIKLVFTAHRWLRSSADMKLLYDCAVREAEPPSLTALKRHDQSALDVGLQLWDDQVTSVLEDPKFNRLVRDGHLSSADLRSFCEESWGKPIKNKWVKHIKKIAKSNEPISAHVGATVVVRLIDLLKGEHLDAVKKTRVKTAKDARNAKAKKERLRKAKKTFGSLAETTPVSSPPP